MRSGWDKKTEQAINTCSNVVEVAGLEPTTSASRTQRSTKLSHTSIRYERKKVVEVAGLEPTTSASRTQRSTKLSHTSIRYERKKVVEVAGLEPTTSASRTQRSTKLSHTSKCFSFNNQNKNPSVANSIATSFIIAGKGGVVNKICEKIWEICRRKNRPKMTRYRCKRRESVIE